MEKIRMIKADAQVSVVFGTPFIKRLHELLFTCYDKLTEEQKAELQQHVQEPEYVYSDADITNCYTLILLVNNIEQIITNNNQFVEEELSSQDN